MAIDKVDALYDAWAIIANVSEGQWSKQTKEWQEAVIRWRDEKFHPILKEAQVTHTEISSLSEGRNG